VDDYADARGVLIASTVLKEHHLLFDEPLPKFWLILDPTFVPEDHLPRYYPEELPILATKTSDELRAIHKAKLAFPDSKITR